MKSGDIILTKTFWDWWNATDKGQYKHPEKDHAFCLLYLGSRDLKSEEPIDPNGLLNNMGWRFLDTLKVTAAFETVDDNVTGTTSADVKRVEQQDDGSITVIIDHWPEPKLLYGYAVEREGYATIFYTADDRAGADWAMTWMGNNGMSPKLVELFR